MSRRYVSSARLQRLETQLTERDRGIVRMLGLTRLASGRQIQRVFWPEATEADARAARRTLVRLTRSRVLARLDRRVGGLGRGSDAYTYGLDTGGQRLLADVKARRPRLPSQMMWSHVFAGTETYVRLVESTRASGRQITTWQGEPESWRTFSGAAGEWLVIKPDAFAEVSGLGFVDASFIEIDTGSQSPAVIRGKLAAYRAYAQSGVEQARTGVFPRVVFVATDDERQGVLVDLIAGQDPDWWAVFSVGQASDVGRLIGGDAI